MKRSLSLLALIALVMVTPVFGGGAFFVNGDGEPLVWDTGQPIVFNLDQGPLGQLSQAEARILALEAFGVWESVPEAAVTFAEGDALPCDLSPLTVAPAGSCGPEELQVIGVGGDGLSPVIFDEDGALVDQLLGVGAANDILGFATITYGSFLPPQITEAEIFLNGRWYDGAPNPESSSREAFQAVFVHENGHWLNLDHSQVNIRYWLDGDGANDRYLPTMFPSSGDDDSQLLTLFSDDMATLADLYPGSGATGLARIQGQVLAPDGAAGERFQGANMILRSVSDPDGEVYSSLSGGFYVPFLPDGLTPEDFGGPPDPALQGAYSFLVPPGSYTLEVEEVEPVFVGGSGIGPLGIPVSVPGTNEYWNENESADPGVDWPAMSSPLDVSAGEVRSGVDLLLNIPPPPALLYAVDDELYDSGSLSGPTAIIELDLASGTILRRIPAPLVNSAFQEGLAWAASRGTLFFTDGASAGRTIYELDPVDGTVLNSFLWPDGALRIDGLAFLNGPDQPEGGVLYALDSDDDSILGLDPDTGGPKGFDIVAGTNLFGALGGVGDDLFVSTFGDQIVHLRPANLANPLVNFFTKPGLLQFDPARPGPGLDQFITGLGYDGEDVYATSINAPDFRVWRIDPSPATDGSVPATRLDVITSSADPTPVRFGGFSAADVAMRGDINGSLRVDGFDLATLARAFATAAGDAAFNTAADLNRDDRVDGEDLNIFAAYFGRGLGAN